MNLFENLSPLSLALIAVGLIVLAFLLRFLMRFTRRILTCGCLTIVVLGGLIWAYLRFF